MKNDITKKKNLKSKVCMICNAAMTNNITHLSMIIITSGKVDDDA